MAKQLEDELRTRVRRQRAIAELGRSALSGADLPALMNATVSLVAGTLEVEYCQILELLPSGDRFVVKGRCRLEGRLWRRGCVRVSNGTAT